MLFHLLIGYSPPLCCTYCHRPYGYISTPILSSTAVLFLSTDCLQALLSYACSLWEIWSWSICRLKASRMAICLAWRDSNRTLLILRRVKSVLTRSYWGESSRDAIVRARPEFLNLSAKVGKPSEARPEKSVSFTTIPEWGKHFCPEHSPIKVERTTYQY